QSSTGPLTTEMVLLPWSGITLSITRPIDIDALLDQVENDPEQNLPYWAELWPSGIALADAIVCEPGMVSGQNVLEIGCGLGATAVAAMRAGARLLAADYFQDALSACLANCSANGVPKPASLAFNWRAADNAIPADHQWPVILAADVLYEKRDIEPLLGFLDQCLAPDGVFWLAEPGRPPAAAWLDAAQTLGWSVESASHAGPWPDPKDEGVVVGLHKVRRS
ncbi:MAG: class I SAM-dependent methyltransferase, partial [Thermomicrobiales bacterium]